MARPFDHLVLGVTDLAEAGARFGALGFTVGATNRHPWGTENRIIQLADATFLELIAVADPALILPPAPGHFSFGAFVRDGIARAPGLAMLALRSDDARETAAEFAAAGIGDFAPFDFARKGRRADGSETEVAFSLAFAASPQMPACGFFACQHHFPENFWSKTAQDHANGALWLSRVTIVAENPSDHHIVLAAFVGTREMRATSFGIESEAGANALGGHGIVEIVPDEGFAFRYGLAAPAGTGPRFAGVEIVTRDLEACARHASAAGIALRSHAGGLVLAPAEYFMTALRLIPAGPVR